jgi:hypothetical protein
LIVLFFIPALWQDRSANPTLFPQNLGDGCVPNYIGVVAGAVFMPLAWPFPYPARLSVIQLLNFPKGIASILLARGMFHLFGLPGHWAILAISVVWISIYYLAFNQPKLGWVSFIAGLVAGWLISPI